MIDVDLVDNELTITDTVVHKAVNLVNTQIEYLVYEPNFGVDLDQFFQPGVEIQTATFKAYLIDRLTANNINVIKAEETGLNLQTLIDITVKDVNSKGFMAQ